jgi:hypothetical protein
LKLRDIKQFLLTTIEVSLDEEKNTSRNRKLQRLLKLITKF